MQDRDPRRVDLAKIHLARKQLGMDEPAYRTMLKSVAGVESAAVLDVGGRRRVIEHLRTLGFRSRPGRHAASRGQQHKIRMLWVDLHANGVVRDPTERAMTRYVKRMTRVDQVARLSSEQATTVIEALKQWRRRAGPVTAAESATGLPAHGDLTIFSQDS